MSSGENRAPDHSDAGVVILTERPSRLFRGVILTLTGLLLAGLAWSFVGRADVIITAPGRLGPEANERLVYSPIPGQLSELYVAEGTPVAEGDTLAKLNAPTAVQLLSGAFNARIKLEETEANKRLFPLRRRALERDLELVEFQIEAAEREAERRRTEGLEKLAEEQRIKLEKARLELAKAEEARDYAKRELDKYRRLFNSAGGGGVSRGQVDEKAKELQTKQADFELARSALAEFEVKMNTEYAKTKREEQSRAEALLRYYILRETKALELASAELQVELALKQARAELEAAEQITVDDLDENGLLRVRAPLAGVVTRVAEAQLGAKIEPKEPLAGIAPADARAVLHLEINERDRALLREGMAVKLKFNAFPYQRYGFIDGTLEYIAPVTSSSTLGGGNRVPVYKGRVSLARDHFVQPGSDQKLPLRFGMTGDAEVEVRQRRLIDFALDPLRGGAG